MKDKYDTAGGIMSPHSFTSHVDLEKFAEFLNVDYETFYEAYYGLAPLDDDVEYDELLTALM